MDLFDLKIYVAVKSQNCSNLKQELSPNFFFSLAQFFECFRKLYLYFQFKIKLGIMKATQVYLGLSLQKFYAASVSHNLYTNDCTPLWLVCLLLSAGS